MKTREIAEFLRGELVGDGDVDIDRVAALESASNGSIAFVEKTERSIVSTASCLIVPTDINSNLSIPFIKTENPKLAFAKMAALLHPAKTRSGEIHDTALISMNARIGTDVFIGAFTCVGERSEIGDGTHLRAGSKVGDDVKVGKNCVLHPNVFVEDGCTIGDNVILHSGVVIGADGFGYVRDADYYVKFPQIGTVVIEDDVEIGANSCIDRGALGETRIGKGTKIDNLVQIAHNVQIGKRVVIAAQTGISGSTVIEDDCIIGGQVGMGDHARVMSGAVIGSQAGVLPGKIVRPGVWWGTPVQPLDEYKRQNAHVKSLERLKADIKEIKKTLDQAD
ncbi:MAG: UDP-3-O-(3-hydroxymyristoyl)glucosamine N-acyltransferase [Chloracidobacterium sp.]|nr:UDP-3-O-(3-hydroxymyristoyl)glucosamine N-acyltransferase [Chloracidobacterium sp.]